MTINHLDRRSHTMGGSDTKGKLHPNINVSSHLDNLGKVHRFLGRVLEIGDGKDLESRVVDLCTSK